MARSLYLWWAYPWRLAPGFRRSRDIFDARSQLLEKAAQRRSQRSGRRREVVDWSALYPKLSGRSLTLTDDA
jgi:hypothetical protein